MLFFLLDDLINGRATRSMSQFPSALQASSLGSGVGLGDSEVMLRSSRHFPAIHQSAAAGKFVGLKVYGADG